MKTAEAIAWFKRTFGERVAAATKGMPFGVDLITAIAQQETGYIWAGLVQRGLAEAEVLRLCVGDTLDADRGRSCFPKNKAELLGATRGSEMFALARQTLLDMARYVNGYQSATINPNKFCHGYGIFQYDIQFFLENPDFFLQQSWGDFEACLTQLLDELKAAMARQGWRNRASLTDDEQVYLAIAYNKGKADCTAGFRQGHESDGKYYGENINEFLQIARGVTLSEAAPAVAVAPKLELRPGAVFEVVAVKGPLRLRSEPCVSSPINANVIARLPIGHLVQRLTTPAQGEFVEVETECDGKILRGFASAKYLREVKRARPVKGKGKRPGKGKKPPLVATEMDLEQMIRAVQAKLGIEVDGRSGPETWKAIYRRIFKKKPVVMAPTPAATNAPDVPAAMQPVCCAPVDSRSEGVIATLQPQVQPYARELVRKAASVGITIKVISGLRTYAEQNALYAQGRDKTGCIVTKARGGYSNHNFGIAFDIGVFEGAKYLDESPKYKVVGALGEELGLEWGGNWKTIQDEPHFQLRPTWAVNSAERDMLAELRTRAGAGRAFYA